MLKKPLLYIALSLSLITTQQVYAEKQAATSQAAPAATQQATSQASNPVLKIQTWQLKNGTEVYFVPLTELPIVDLNIIFNAGSSHDDKLFGLATFTNSSFGEGTSKLNADQIADQMAELGAMYSNSNDRDSASLSFRSMTQEKYLNPAVDLFSDILNDPKLPTKSYNRIKNQLLQSIKQQQETPSSIATKTLFKTIYGNNPYGHDQLGTPETINKITPQQLTNFYKKYYVGNNAVMIIVGNVSRSQAESIANKTAGKLPSGNAAKPIKATSLKEKAAQKKITYPSSQTSIRLGELGISRDNPDYFPLMVGNYILGGGPLTSRLFKAVREERGLSYFVYSQFIPMKMQGPFVISLQTKPEKSQQAISVINNVVDDFVEKGPSQQELIMSKKHIIGNFPLKLDSNAAIMASLTMIAFYHLPLDYLDTYRDKVSAVTITDITKAFKKHLQTQQLVTVTVGPKVSETKKDAKKV